MASKDLKEFDENFSIKVFDYHSTETYLRNISCVSRINGIQVPTLFINSKDDKFAPFDAIPFDEFKHNGNTLMVLSQIGGHVGWFEGFFKPKRVKNEITQWYLKPMIEFLNSLNNEID